MVAEALGAALTALAVLALVLYRMVGELREVADGERSQRQKVARELAKAELQVEYLDSSAAHLRDEVDILRKDLRDATERIMTMKRDGFSSGMPKVEEEDRPELPAELEGFLGRVRSAPAADQMREDALEAVRRGEEPSMILEKFKQGRPIWDV